MTTLVDLVMVPLLPWIRTGVGTLGGKYGGSRGGQNRVSVNSERIPGGLDSAALLHYNYQQIYLLGWIHTIKKLGHPYTDTSPYK